MHCLLAAFVELDIILVNIDDMYNDVCLNCRSDLYQRCASERYFLTLQKESKLKASAWSALNKQTFIEVGIEQPNKASIFTKRAPHITQ